MTLKRVLPGTTIVIALLLFPVLATSGNPQAGGTIGPEAMADNFGRALSESDEATVRNVLHVDVLIFESGNVEGSLEEYAAHHMSADMAFMAGIEKEIISRKVFEEGNTAVVSTRYQMSGSYKDRVIDMVSSETLVMQKTGDEWKIVHVHWS